MALQQGQITITGRVGSNPQGHGNGSPPTICTFRLGSTRGYYDASRKWRSLPTTWITVKAYRTLAANVHASVRTGDPIIVVGVLATEEWSSENGEKRSRIVIEASNVGHDLNYGMTRPSAGKRESGGETGAGAGGGNGGQGAVDAATGVNGAVAGSVPEPVSLLANDPYRGSNAQVNMPANGGASAATGASDCGAAVVGGVDGDAARSASVGSAGDADGNDGQAPDARQYTNGFAQPVQDADGSGDAVPPPNEPPGDEFGAGEF
ncbi:MULTISPECIES: single-stranded DNA-binding protein [Bifidobacterium]|uniref:single-stranded DNA-binding protein n=1 Tax=Bifidobacterium TaxID=1678 RepID=UPI001F0B1723|nr:MULTISPECIES: single-stranded DNA-binding protein [Bifidobacterium]